MDADQARQQVEFIRKELMSGADGGILDSNTLHGLLFHALRGVEAEAEIARLRAALDAASFYINASDRELSEAGMTRADALTRFHELHGPIYLEQSTP